MNVENALQIAAQVAGIGGLAIVLFLTIARTTLKILPRPEKPPARSFFRTIDRVMLFAFILSVAGLVVYALLSLTNHAVRIGSTMSAVERQNEELNQKLSRLQRDYDEANNTIQRIRDVELKIRSAGIQILSAEITFDFRNWAEVPPEELQTVRRSSEVTTSRRRIWRAYPETEKFFATYSTTSPFEPDFSCDSHNMLVKRNTDRLQNGKPVEDRWILEYDISNVRDAPIRKPFDITSRIEAWNTRQNPKEESEGTFIMFPTQAVTMNVLFPARKHPVQVECFYYPLENNHSAVPFENPKLTFAPDRSWVRWEIEQPSLGYHYVIRWKW